ncbi:MAG: HD-GYP domain-containing protein [Pseudobdellovibrionaceae bacterium]
MDNPGKFFRIRLSTMRPEKVTSFDVFIFIDDQFILYLKAGDRISDGKIKLLHGRDTGDSFFVNDIDKQKYRDWVKEDMNSDILNPFEKAQILRESSVAILEDLFENPDVHQAIDDARPMINDFLDLMEAEPESMSYLISLSGHDFYTYNHSLDVSIYALGLGMALTFDRKTMEELGVGSLFHDIGKRNVSLDILCKKGSLDENEWAQMKMHPQYGLVILNENPSISDGIKAACFEHHESWSGNGYPQQISGQEIHPFARIVAITDTYDAMTTQRSYNVPMKPKDAIEMITEKLTGRYDPEMLKALRLALLHLKETG